MQTQLPKITVITANYNQGNFIETCIKSVLDQDYSNIEYLIFDGNSTDQSVDIIRKYENRLTYWKSEKDNGQTHAINKGLKMATGEIITWLNSDDYFLPGSLMFAANQYTEGKYDFILGNCIFVDVNGQPIADQKKSTLLNGHDFIPGHHACVVNQPSSFFSKKILSKTGLLDEKLHYAMDVDFWMKIIAHQGEMRYVDVNLTCFRRHNEAKSAAGNLPFITETLNSTFFKDQLKPLDPHYYTICKKSIYRSYFENLILEHQSKKIFGFYSKILFVLPLFSTKKIISYIFLKIKLKLRAVFKKN